MTRQRLGIQPKHGQQALAQRICADLRPSLLADALLLRFLSDLLGILLKLCDVLPVNCEYGSSACEASPLPAETLYALPQP